MANDQRKGIALLALFLLLIAALALYPLWSKGQTKAQLIGRWRGEGAVRGEANISIEGASLQKNPLAGKTTIDAEFKSDGTYTWYEEIHGTNITLNMTVPKGDAKAPFSITGVDGNTIRIRIHAGDTEFVFQDRDTFTMNFGGAGTVTFRRVTGKAPQAEVK